MNAHSALHHNPRRYRCGTLFSSMLVIGLIVCSARLAQGLELPGGSSAQIIAEPDSGFLLLQNGKRSYYVAIHALLGVQPKANGSGCTLLIQTDQQVQLVDVATMPEELLMALRISRPAPAPMPAPMPSSAPAPRGKP